jgi:hypothetical protein
MVLYPLNLRGNMSSDATEKVKELEERISHMWRYL